MSKWTLRPLSNAFAFHLWHFHVKVPPDIVEALVCGADRCVITTFDGRVRVHCVLTPAGNGGWFLNLNKEPGKKPGIGLGHSVRVEREKDDPPCGMPVPDELAELLRQDEEGICYFHDPTPGKQRSLIHLAGKYKRFETSLHKAIVFESQSRPARLQGTDASFQRKLKP